MAGPSPLRSGKRRPMGVYAPPHLREEYLVEAKNHTGGTKNAGVDLLQEQSSELVKPEKQSSRSKLEQPKGVARGHWPERAASAEASELISNEGKMDAWEDCPKACKAVPFQAMFLATSRRFERESSSEDWLHWLERLICSAHIQMDAVVALYLDGLLRMETGEGPEEKRAGLTEFVDAMLPAESIDDDSRQQVMGFATMKEGVRTEKFRRGQKITRLIDNVWGAWQEWGAESSKQQGSDVLEEKEGSSEDFDVWLNARMWALGLDPEVCVPYVTGLLEMEEGGSALSEFLADAALQEATATLDFDPVATTDEIVARYRRQRSIKQAACGRERLEEPALSAEKESRKTKRKAKKKTLPVDLFSHWWSSDLGIDWGKTASDDNQGSSHERDSWHNGSWGGNHNARAGVSGQLMESGEIDAGMYQNGRSSSSRRSSNGLPASKNLPNMLESGKTNGTRYQSSPGKPPTSVIVARRMILHVLGLKDPNKRRH